MRLNASRNMDAPHKRVVDAPYLLFVAVPSATIALTEPFRALVRSSATMMAETYIDEQEWPTLGAQRKVPHDTDDWELLTPEEDQFDPVEIDTAYVQQRKPSLRHSASSPDLRRIALKVVAEEPNDDSSYSVVSRPGSVVSLMSGMSFKDAVSSSRPQSPSPDARDDQAPRSAPRPRRIKAKFVVTPIKRCAKSTGDLQSLTIHEEEEVENFMGDADAPEYYSQKAVGARGRANGLKIRPDEAKRKEFTLQKKSMQRQANAKR